MPGAGRPGTAARTGVLTFVGSAGPVVSDAAVRGSGRAANGTYWRTPSPTITNRFLPSLDAMGPSSIWLNVADTFGYSASERSSSPRRWHVVSFSMHRLSAV